MIIRQEESTPIGNYFHDSGILKVFTKLEESVDKFEVETNDLKAYCDNLITSLKGLKNQINATESAWEKHQQQQRIKDMTNKE